MDPMLKLLLCLIATFAIAGVLLHLRHERMEINYRINQAHRRLQDLQVELWSQQCRIGAVTNAATIEKVLSDRKIKLVPASPIVKVDPND